MLVSLGRRLVRGGPVVLGELTGELDHAGMAAVTNTVTTLMVEGKTRVVLDLNKVKGASLMHVGVLVEKMRLLRRRGGDLKLVGMGDELWRVFDGLGTGEMFSRFKMVEEAIEDFNRTEVG